MTTQQVFGGAWTEDKLECLHKYLSAYRTIFSKNERARHFTTWYVDAFAGTGERGDRDDPDEAAYRQGSALRAVTLPNPFDKYLFIEKFQRRLANLRSNVERHAETRIHRCDFVCADANEGLTKWCADRDWKKERAVVFLDPFGAQVRWGTIENLAKTRGIDLWYLFPLSAVLRLLTLDGSHPEAWRQRLTDVFGNVNWEQAFYEPERQSNLFSETVGIARTATPDAVCRYVQSRLKQAFPAVCDKQLVLYNSKNSPLFAFCFAAANPGRGGHTAVKIAKDIVGGIG